MVGLRNALKPIPALTRGLTYSAEELPDIICNDAFAFFFFLRCAGGVDGVDC